MLGLLGLVLTFLSVVVAWVFFRAPTLDGAVAMLAAMAGGNGIVLPSAFVYSAASLADALKDAGVQFEAGGGREFVFTWAWIAALGCIAFLLPNTQELMQRYRPALNLHLDRLRRWQWRPTAAWSAYAAGLMALGVLSLPEVSAFLYFQF